MPTRIRVMVDARMLIGRFSGVGRVVTQLVDELVKQDGIEVVALCGYEIFPQWVDRTDIEVMTCGFDREHRTPGRRVLWEETRLPQLIRQAHVDLFHATWNHDVPLRCPVPAVLTIHDLIPWREPEAHFTTFRQRLYYRYAVRSSARRAAYVTTVSEYVRRQVVDTLCLPPNRVVTVPNGVRTPGRQDILLDASCPPYVLYVGGFEPRKNLTAVFATMQRYWERYDPALQLWLTGDAQRLSGEAGRMYGALKTDTRVRFLGDIGDADLARYYASARASLMLSHDEGFGLPVLEAMAYGCPVIAAARAALPEVVADAGVLVDPDRIDEVSDALRTLMADPIRRDDYIRRGRRRAMMFCWEAAAVQMRTIYERALASRRYPSIRWAAARTTH